VKHTDGCRTYHSSTTVALPDAPRARGAHGRAAEISGAYLAFFKVATVATRSISTRPFMSPKTSGRHRRVVAILASIGTLSLYAAPARAARTGSITGTITANGAGADDVVVSLHAAGLSVKPPAAPVEMDQRGKKFVPHVLPIVEGTTVKFLNSDPFDHNVFSPEGHYDLGTWGQRQSKDHTFSRPGAYTQLCRIHPEMEGFVVVLNTPYFAKTTDSGRFTIADVPVGHYTLITWSERFKEVRQPVTIEAGKPAAVQVALHK
jgi:plastocyanin